MAHQTNWNTSPSINPKKSFRIHLIVFLIAVPAMWIVWFLIDSTYPWPLWSTAAWAIGIIFHYLGVFVFGKSKNN